MPLIIRTSGSGRANLNEYDPEALAYIRAVESADNQNLENNTRKAINRFIVGCKIDRNWNAIKSSCILAGARTLNGALVPLKGNAPTNFNFVNSDYNRATGLVGNGFDKYLNSNRNHNSDPRDNFHQTVYVSQYNFSPARETLIGYSDSLSATSMIQHFATASAFYLTNRTQIIPFTINHATLTYPQFFGTSRNNNLNYSYFVNNTNNTIANNSVFSSTPVRSIIVFGNQLPGGGTAVGQFSRARIAFYSLGENINLSLLNSRVTTLMNNFSNL